MLFSDSQLLIFFQILNYLDWLVFNFLLFFVPFGIPKYFAPPILIMRNNSSNENIVPQNINNINFL